MSNPVIVCNYDESLLSRLKRRHIVVRVDDPFKALSAVKLVQEKNVLQALWLLIDAPFSHLPCKILEALANVPLYLDVAEIGNFREWRDQVDLLRKLKVRLMIPEEAPGSYRDLRILSSLLIPCGIRFGNCCPDWDALTDLMCYAAYGKIPHAPIQPFHFVLTCFERHMRVDFNSVYFEDPSRYLHVDNEGHIALTRMNLDRGWFIETDLENLDAIADLPAYQAHGEAWREVFLTKGRCAYCPAWRICLGTFDGVPGSHPSCESFFMEFLEAAEHHLTHRMEAAKTVRSLWD